MNQIITTLAALSVLNLNVLNGSSLPKENILAAHEFSLNDRYENKFVNDVFKDNILLNMAYLDGKATSPSINWEEVRKPFSYAFSLKPKETFAFHDDVLPRYKGKVARTTNAHFNAQEGFHSDGYLFGDGVCHLASLISWAARDAHLDVLVPTNHDFAHIPEVPKEYGVAIYNNGKSDGGGASQNLYVTNNTEKEISFRFEFNNDKLKVSVVSESTQ